jgi:chromosome partitioning protein
VADLRPPGARPISTWETTADQIVKPPRGTTHVVLDTPAGLHGWRFNDVMKMADKVVVPLQPSVFDIFATRQFLDQLAEHRLAGKMQLGDTQNYIHLAARGLTVFDVSPSRVEKDLEQWQGLCRWLDAP